MNFFLARRAILPLVAGMTLLAGTAFAAPTCQDKNGHAIKCGTQGAMAVGWTLPAADRPMIEPLAPSTDEWLETICVLGVFFALLALLPECDGWRAGDWEWQEGDETRRD